MDKVRGKHYQLACGLAFEGITGEQQETGINKPSEYYAASIELERQRAAAAAGGGGATAGDGSAAGQQQQQHAAAAGTGAPPFTPAANGRAAMQH